MKNENLGMENEKGKIRTKRYKQKFKRKNLKRKN